MGVPVPYNREMAAEATFADGHPAVVSALRERMGREGRLSFAEFANIALYLPGGGYYARADSRPERDYLTSPAVHPLFGALVALQLEQMWQVLGRPERFTVVEAGAGDGQLGDDILSYASNLEAGFWHALEYVIVEPLAAAMQRQRARMRQAAGKRVAWVNGSALSIPLREVVGCVLSNELVDAFPVHRVVVWEGRLQESFIETRGGVAREVASELSTASLSAYFDRLSVKPAEGVTVAVNLQGAAFVASAARALRRGFLLTVDYGREAEALYGSEHPGGGLRCYHKHRLSNDPYRAPGYQDITADVDFSTLILAGRAAGLNLTGLTSQRDALLNLGFSAFARQLESAGLPESTMYVEKLAMHDQIARGGLGAFRVLVQHKGVHDPELDLFNECNDRKRLLLAGRRSLPLPSFARRSADERR